MKLRAFALLIFVFCLLPSALTAGEADVVAAKVQHMGDDTFRFDVTVQHRDTGWEHYANKWEVVGEDGKVLGTRVLAHPHVEEQPFTRSGTFKIPTEITKVFVRAGDSVHEEGGRIIVMELER